MPLATDNDTLIDEKLPGPLLTTIEKFLSTITSYFSRNLIILLTSSSFFLVFVCIFSLKKILLTLKPIKSFLPVQLIIKKSFITLLFIVILSFTNKSHSATNNIEDYGIITLMYHRFEQNKYPSTNIKIEQFINQLNLIKKSNISYVNPNNFENSLKNKNQDRKILLTIDDSFLSFYNNAWPILKKNKIPFILFVNTKDVGNFDYMSWDQIKELSKEDFVHIGNHSHTHGYLIDEDYDYIKADIVKSIKILNEKIGYKSNFFSYPFGEYSVEFKEIVKELGFKFAFGQHSGVADISKKFLELPRFPINEKYGETKRFQTLLNTLPLKYKKITPDEKYISSQTNPPDVQIEFFENIKNLKLINCYSNEGDVWSNSEIKFVSEYKLKINLKGPFVTERGRINCSIIEENNMWRWLGIQFVVAEK